MKHNSIFILSLLILLFTSCKLADYDVEEVASDAHMGTVHEHEHDIEHDQEHEIEPEDTQGNTHQTHMHVHPPNERNHGTEWFFNQPWAAPFIWPKMIRDTLILIILATAITLLSRKFYHR